MNKLLFVLIIATFICLSTAVTEERRKHTLKNKVQKTLSHAKFLRAMKKARAIEGAAEWVNYFEGEQYQEHTRQEKFAEVWKQVEKDPSSGEFSTLSTLSAVPRGLSSTIPSWMTGDQNLAGVMQNTGDYLKRSHKLIHSIGVTAKVSYRATSQKYSGILGQGADSAIMRFSTGTEYNPSSPPVGNFAPGFGLKFFRNGMQAANLVAMFSVAGQESWNPFAKDFTTDVPNPPPEQQNFALNMISMSFSWVTPYTQNIGTSDIASYDQEGNPVQQLKFPYKLIFRPSQEVQAIMAESAQGQNDQTFVTDYKEILKELPAGTPLYDVIAMENPSELCEDVIGQIHLDSQFRTSLFADTTLFFRHQNFQEDIDAAANQGGAWNEYVNYWGWFGHYLPEQEPTACPVMGGFAKHKKARHSKMNAKKHSKKNAKKHH